MTSPRKSSSSFIFEALGSTNTNAPSERIENENNEDILVKIHQKCYGYITPDSPKHIKGLYTDGLNTCSGIVLLVHNTKNDYIFFCHADSETNLTSILHGVPSWINKIPSELNQITIHDDNALSGHYKQALEKIRDDIQSTTSKTINLIPYEGDISEMVAIRGEKFIRDNINHVFDTIDKFSKDSSDIDYYLSDLIEYKYENQTHDPICVFDSKKLLMQEDIVKSQPWIAQVIEQSNQQQNLVEHNETNVIKNPGMKFG